MTTNEAIFVSCDTNGVTIAVNGENKRVSWDMLRKAAAQDDPDLRGVYSRLLQDAESEAAAGPVVVEVDQDSTNVWWVATVSAAIGGGYANYYRCADEGGTLPNRRLATSEARRICERLGKRVARRVGF